MRYLSFWKKTKVVLFPNYVYFHYIFIYDKTIADSLETTTNFSEIQ